MTPVIFLRLRNTLLSAALLCVSSGGLASPTVDEFQACHRMVSASLQECLDQHTWQRNDVCWRQARQENDHCHAAVWSRYARPDPKREAARRKAEAEAEASAKAKAAMSHAASAPQ